MKKLLLLPFCLLLFSCGYTNSQSISADNGSTIEGVTQEVHGNGKSGVISMCSTGVGNFVQTQNTPHLLAKMIGEELTLTNTTKDSLNMTMNKSKVTLQANESRSFREVADAKGCINIKY